MCTVLNFLTKFYTSYTNILFTPRFKLLFNHPVYVNQSRFGRVFNLGLTKKRRSFVMAGG